MHKNPKFFKSTTTLKHTIRTLPKRACKIRNLEKKQDCIDQEDGIYYPSQKQNESTLSSYADDSQFSSATTSPINLIGSKRKLPNQLFMAAKLLLNLKKRKSIPLMKEQTLNSSEEK